MTFIVRAFPLVRPVAEVEAFFDQLRERRAETAAFYGQFGVRQELAFLQETAHGPLLLAVTEADNPGEAAPRYQAGQADFEAWFKGEVQRLSGIDPNLQPLGPSSRPLFHWPASAAEAAADRAAGHLSPAALTRVFFEQVWNQGDDAAIDRLIAPNARFHGLSGPDGGELSGPAGFRTVHQLFRGAFPDIRIELLSAFESGDMVACHAQVTGTHLGPGLGPKPSEKPVRFEGQARARVRNGQIQEGWNSFDFLTMYQQIGLLPSLSS